MAEVKLKLKAEPRWFFHIAFEALAWACALTSLVSERAASWLSSKGSVFIALSGMKFTAE